MQWGKREGLKLVQGSKRPGYRIRNPIFSLRSSITVKFAIVVRTLSVLKPDIFYFQGHNRMIFIRVIVPSGVVSVPDPFFENKPDPDPTLVK